MASEIFMARQPIVNELGHTYAFELLFRDLTLPPAKSAEDIIVDNRNATARVVVNTLNQFGVKNIVGDSLAFINTDADFLFSDIILNIPKEQFIIEVLEHVKVTPSLVKRIQFLKEKGYNFALDDATFDDEYLESFKPLFPLVDVIKIDITLTSPQEVEQKKQHLQGYDFILLAEKVETKEDFEIYKALGCVLFQGYYFAKPEIKQQTSLDTNQLSIIKLTNMLNDDNCPLKDIVQAFDQEPGISIQLLKFLNSAQFNFKTPIKSVQQIITLMGKAPLRNWMYLLTFTSNKEGKRPPLLELAVTRSQMIEKIAFLHTKDKKKAAEANFVGMLSLIESIFNLPLATILEELTLDDSVKNAILSHDGILGKYLKIVLALEKFKVDECQELAQEIGISLEEIQTIMYQCYDEINQDILV